MPPLKRVSLPIQTTPRAISDDSKFFFDQQNPLLDRTIRTPKNRNKDLIDFSDIRCPLCGWLPTSSHRWFCAPCDYPEDFADGCGACWNTFITGGRCPCCSHRWRWTACLSCEGWSLHENWYKNDARERH